MCVYVCVWRAYLWEDLTCQLDFSRICQLNTFIVAYAGGDLTILFILMEENHVRIHTSQWPGFDSHFEELFIISGNSSIRHNDGCHQIQAHIFNVQKHWDRDRFIMKIECKRNSYMTTLFIIVIVCFNWIQFSV